MKKIILLCFLIHTLRATETKITAAAVETKRSSALDEKWKEKGRALVTPRRSVDAIVLIDTIEEDKDVGGPITTDFSVAVHQLAAPIVVYERTLEIFLSLRQQWLQSHITAEDLKRREASLEQEASLISSKKYDAQQIIQSFSEELELRKQVIERLQNDPSEKATFLSLLKGKSPGLFLLLNFIEDARKYPELMIFINKYPSLASLHEQVKKIDVEDTDLKYMQMYLRLYELFLSLFKNFEEDLGKRRKEITQEQIKNIAIDSQYQYSRAHFDVSQWYIFKHATEGIYLLIPKNYQEKVMKEYDIQVADLKVQEQELQDIPGISVREQALGFAVDHKDILIPVNLTSEYELLHSVMQKSKKEKVIDFPLAAFKQLFVAGKFAQLPGFNFYQAGHGSFKEDNPTIAGLPFDAFKEFLRFLTSTIKTSFLYYISCFAGGRNLEKVRQELVNFEKIENKSIEAVAGNFIVAVGSLTDISVQHCDLNDAIWQLNFTNFFSDLTKFFTGTETFSQDPFKQILNHVTVRGECKELSNISSIYFPGTGIFRAQEFDKDIMVLTYAKLRSHSLLLGRTEVEPIKTEGKAALLLYPNIITVPIILGLDPQGKPTRLVSMNDGEMLFPFIDASSITLLEFLQQSIAGVKSLGKRSFWIRRLRSKNYANSGLESSLNAVLELEDVIVASSSGNETITWKIEFEMNDKDAKKSYQGTMIYDGNTYRLTGPTWQLKSTPEPKIPEAETKDSSAVSIAKYEKKSCVKVAQRMKRKKRQQA